MHVEALFQVKAHGLDQHLAFEPLAHGDDFLDRGVGGTAAQRRAESSQKPIVFAWFPASSLPVNRISLGNFEE